MACALPLLFSLQFNKNTLQNIPSAVNTLWGVNGNYRPMEYTVVISYRVIAPFYFSMTNLNFQLGHSLKTSLTQQTTGRVIQINFGNAPGKVL
jgi:hypothetical protein